MNLKARLVLPAAVAAVFVGLSLTPVPAEAGSHYAVPQGRCDKVGEQRPARNGETYRCEQRRGDDCPLWHWVYRPDKPQGSWSPRPGQPCTKCSASARPSPSRSAQPSKSVSATPSQSATAHSTTTGTTTTPPGEDENGHPGTLPVTGPRAALLAIAGTATVMLGAGALWFGRKPRRRKSYPPR